MEQPNYCYTYKPTDTSPQDAPSRLLKGDMKSLFLLSLMLTADVDSAESCFVSTLDDCISMKSSVSEWTNGWTRRVLVHNAIAMLRPTIDDDEHLVRCNLALHPALHAVMRLKNFERFVFVLSILEGYSDHACSVLLGSSSRDIMAAKVRVLENLAANLNACLPEVRQNWVRHN